MGFPEAIPLFSRAEISFAVYGEPGGIDGG
jgi:hypothetical protein